MPRGIKKLTKQWKENLSKNHRKYQSKKTKEKISISLIGNKRTLGYKHTNKTREKMRESGVKRWDKNGRNPHLRNKHQDDSKYKQWRSGVFERDNWTCQTCGKRGGYLEAHHIKKWAKFPELRYEMENGVTLCLDCHKLTNNYKGKK